jgi:predicted acetyltransferase
MDIRILDMTDTAQAKAALQVGAAAFRSSARYRQLLDDIGRSRTDGTTLPDPARGDPASRVWGAWLDGRLIAVSRAIDYVMRFEGQDVPMCGIGGVATLPEYRRQGAVRQIMCDLLRHSRDQGCLFSWLFPFSFAFYRRFGYGYACQRQRIEFPAALLRQLPETGQVRRCSLDDLADIRAVYNRFTLRTNGTLDRSAGMWRQWLDKDPWLDQVYTYLWSDDQGQPGAWLSIETKRESGNDVLKLLDWACVSHAALRGLLAFLQRIGDSYTTISLASPLHINWNLIFAEPYPLKRTLETAGQVRVLDIKTALGLLKRPGRIKSDDPEPDLSGAAPVRLLVEDAFLPENSGLYTFDLYDPQQPVSQSPAASDSERYDLSLSVDVLSTLLLGGQRLEDLFEHPDLKAGPDWSLTRHGALCRLFAGRPCCIYDSF